MYITLCHTASSTSSAPVTINISSVSTTSFTVKGVSGGAEAVKINVPTGSKGTLTIEDIDHVEISGDWEKVTASTGENTFVVKAGAVIKELVVTKGNIEIATDAVVNKLTLEADVTINSRLYVPVGAKMEVILGTHEFTLGGDYYTRIYGGGELVLTGDETYKGKVTDKTAGISLYGDGAKFTMKNVDYKAAKTGGRGVFIDKRYSSALIDIENSIDQEERDLQQKHVERLTRNECTPEAGMIFSDLVSGLERVADHATNIAFSILDEDPEEKAAREAVAGAEKFHIWEKRARFLADLLK